MDTVWLILTAGAAFAAVAACAILAPRFLRFSSPTAVLVVAVLGAVLGVVAPGAPTKIVVLDGVLRAPLRHGVRARGGDDWSTRCGSRRR